jgi:hypothetical protein
MKKWTILFVFFIITFFFNYNKISAIECRVVRIYSGIAAESIRNLSIDPERTTILKDTCVIFVNLSLNPEVMINFKEGKKCEEGTGAPNGFKLDQALGCYVSGFLPKGGTASLWFKEGGTYKYVVQATPQKTVVAEGEITVSEGSK